MTSAARHIIETYAELFERLDAETKLALLERLEQSIRKERKSKEEDFFSSFGGLVSEKPAEEIIKEIRESRKFRSKDLKI